MVPRYGAYVGPPMPQHLCHNSCVKLAIIGFGNVGRALAQLLRRKRADFPFTITGIHTLRHGTAVDPAGLPDAPQFGPRMASVEEFFDAARAGLGLRFESAVMDGAPVFNLWHSSLPGVQVLGFTGVLNSTSKVVIETMERGGSFEEGLAAARQMGITEGDGAYDIEGWDSAAKAAALANVLMDARTTPQQVSTRGIARLTPARMQEMARQGKTVRLISRGRRDKRGITLRVRAEVLDRNDLLAATPGTTNLILFHTDLMGTFGTVSIEPQVEQTAYGVFSDLVNLMRH